MDSLAEARRAVAEVRVPFADGRSANLEVSCTVQGDPRLRKTDGRISIGYLLTTLRYGETLAHSLAEAATPPDRLQVQATFVFGERADQVHVDLTVRGQGRNLAAPSFAQAALQAARHSQPFVPPPITADVVCHATLGEMADFILRSSPPRGTNHSIDARLTPLPRTPTTPPVVNTPAIVPPLVLGWLREAWRRPEARVLAPAAVLLTGLIVVPALLGAPHAPARTAAPPTVAVARPAAVSSSLATPGAAMAVARVPSPATLASTESLPGLFEERFAHTWPTNPAGTAWYAADGRYHLLARNPGQFVAVSAPIGQPPSDVAVTATFRKVGGPPGGGYGVILRDQASTPRDGLVQRGRFYVLEVGDRGEVGIWRREADEWVDLVPWTASPAVRPGLEPNTLEARAVGSRLTLRVNGAVAAEVQDSALSAGGLGLFVGGDGNEAIAEQFLVDGTPASADGQGSGR